MEVTSLVVHLSAHLNVCWTDLIERNKMVSVESMYHYSIKTCAEYCCARVFPAMMESFSFRDHERSIKNRDTKSQAIYSHVGCLHHLLLQSFVIKLQPIPSACALLILCIFNSLDLFYHRAMPKHRCKVGGNWVFMRAQKKVEQWDC